MKKIFVTGGAGFIGSALIRHLIRHTNHKIICVDKITYAGNLNSLKEVIKNKNFKFEKVNICNSKKVNKLLSKYKPEIIFHLAAESHVDNSIMKPSIFINTNIIGTYNLLNETQFFLNKLKLNDKKKFRFIHISTDEVYGDLGFNAKASKENSPYAPSSPYSASKASSDHLVKAWIRTYKFPGIITNCSNNYGPHQNKEKLIPMIISKLLKKEKIPIYGNGQQIRDWIYVDDHIRALYLIATKGRLGESYNIGGGNQIKNIDMVKKIYERISNFNKYKSIKLEDYKSLITFVKDRAGHDYRYDIDCSKLKRNLKWRKEETLNSGLLKTIDWYLKSYS
tara:strand:- start:397 stop:1407 length:1011 start_codon:yes stop_codon:yes gene_type:complete